VFGGHAAGIEVTNGGGGVTEGNEMCDNHFDGICLATGVAPTLSGLTQWWEMNPAGRRTLVVEDNCSLSALALPALPQRILSPALGKVHVISPPVV